MKNEAFQELLILYSRMEVDTMSSPGSPRASTVLDPTRQQLDELDALLESMLALPVNRLDNELDAPPSASSSSAASLSRSAVQSSESKVARPVPPPIRPAGPEPDSRSPESSKQRSVLQPKAATAAAHPSGSATAETVYETEKAPASESRSSQNGRKKGKNPQREETESVEDRPAPKRPVPTFFGKPASPPSSVREPQPAMWLYPLIGINGLFDFCTRLLGNPGRWLRRPRGRTFLGWIGLLLLAAALLLLAIDQIGWTW